MSQPLTLYPLPYTVPQPPPGLFRNIETVSEHSASDTEAFNTGLRNRDVFLGTRRCIVCGESGRYNLKHCHIVGRKDDEAWMLLKQLGWVPEGIKESPEQESRNGLTMCVTHRREFNNWAFFIRFQPTTGKYILIHYDSYSAYPKLEKFHGKAVALDIKDNHAPLPLLFLVHEYMARGRNFYQPTPDLNITNNFQDWIINDGVLNEEIEDGRSFSFKRKAPTPGPPGQSSNVEASTTTQAAQTSGPTAGQSLNVQRSSTTQVASNSGSRTVIMPPTADLVEELMGYQPNQRTMPSWKAS